MDSNCKIKRQGQTLSEQGNKNGIDDKLETTFTHLNEFAIRAGVDPSLAGQSYSIRPVPLLVWSIAQNLECSPNQMLPKS